MIKTPTICIDEQPVIPSDKGCAVTIGNFDGVHKGHQALIRHTIEFCHKIGVPSVVLTFWPHPRYVIGKEHIPLTTREARRQLIAELQPDWIWEVPFTRSLASMEPEEFIRRYLAAISMRRLIVGRDFSLGKGRSGLPCMLQSLGRAYGYTLEQMSPVRVDGTVVSSSRIRHLVEFGGVETATRMIGRPHFATGTVIHGDGRGAALGIPTANIPIPSTLLPVPGVYITRATINGKSYQAVTNLGSKPTFGGSEPALETHLLDAPSGLEVYGQELHLDFLCHLRAEKRFADGDALVAQINEDILVARTFFANSTWL